MRSPLAIDTQAYHDLFGDEIWVVPGFNVASIHHSPQDKGHSAQSSVQTPGPTTLEPARAIAQGDFGKAEASTKNDTVKPKFLDDTVIARVKNVLTPKQDDTREAIQSAIRSCQDCELAGVRTSPVVGEGAATAEIMFISGHPDVDEDRVGRPLMGYAGQLFTDIIEKGMRLARSEVYVTTITKCSTKGQQAVDESSILACRKHLDAEIAWIRPRYVVALGADACNALLPGKSFSEQRGQWTDIDSYEVLVTWHPLHLLNNRSAKKDTWIHIQSLLAKLRHRNGNGLQVGQGRKE